MDSGSRSEGEMWKEEHKDSSVLERAGLDNRAEV